ncbi:gamma-glutamyl-gamma-aminobutyrate hydrolase family protein [Luteolibacter sp. LG18]|uniref:gamma-glutamyl-gamma-aminobutyrate hydrolase family protein n=1 Tax=Luteolibacter sp. LG18 TaxID=2819286 RepID=UPI002B2EAEFA|nr:glutamine amidotransferase [Luteolibacter sp. LG18]
MHASASPARPVVLIASCKRELDGFPTYTIRNNYIEALTLVGCQGLIVPEPAAGDFSTLLAVADGILFNGSPSNVHPSHYGEEVHDPSLPQDRDRDAWTLPLIRLALERGIPLFGICRGYQEMNVALGGSLHQAVHEVPGFFDHRPDDGDPLEKRYAIAHSVEVVPGGLLEGILGAPSIEVNSVHGQGVNRLAPSLRAEAKAPDGLVEAFTCPGAKGFNLAVQWHPEWRPQDHPASLKVLQAFGDACLRHHQDRASVTAAHEAVFPG